MEQRESRVVFMAFGTQGDVYPLAAVASGLVKGNKHLPIYFVTHSAHESLMVSLAASGVIYVPVTSAPVLSVACLDKYTAATATDETTPQLEHDAKVVGSVWKLKLEEQHRRECLMAVDKILGSSGGQAGDYLVINFFALEGWHLAELYGVPCLVAAPYVVPYSAPASFERRFRKAYPILYDKLKREIPGKVGWDDVMHWMWPLFTEHWTEWRIKQLHLSACPLTDPVTELPVQLNWPAKPLVLYGFSEDVVECPSYWPSSVHVCGFWFLESKTNSCGLKPDSENPTSTEMGTFLNESSFPPIFVGLSCIGSMGLLHNPEGMLSVLGRALQAVDCKAILFTAAYPPLDVAVLAAATAESASVSTFDGVSPSVESKAADREGCRSYDLNLLKKGLRLCAGRLFCFSGSVPYLWLFPRCSLIIHHGGSGTTAAALQSGIPQIICPFVLDQFYWAERMAWIGVAPQPLRREHLIPHSNSEIGEAVSKLSCAIFKASDPKVQECAAALGAKIRRQDGVAFAARVLSERISS